MQVWRWVLWLEAMHDAWVPGGNWRSVWESRLFDLNVLVACWTSELRPLLVYGFLIYWTWKSNLLDVPCSLLY